MTYQWQMRVCFQDTDAEGIVYHANYLNYAERARTAWLFELGYTNQGVLNSGIMLVLRHLDIDYRLPAKLDDLLTIDVRIREIKNASMVIEQLVSCQDKTLVAITLQLAFISPETMRPVRLPTEMKNLFIDYMNKQGEI